MPSRVSSASSVRTAVTRSSGILGGRGLGDGGLVRLAEPAAGVQRLVEDALELRARARDEILGVAERSGSVSASTAASTSASV